MTSSNIVAFGMTAASIATHAGHLKAVFLAYARIHWKAVILAYARSRLKSVILAYARSRLKSVILAYARIHLALALVLLGVSHAFAAETRDPAQFFSLNTGDLKAEAADARADGKKALLLVFEQVGCPYCRYMREKVLNQKVVQDYYGKNFASFTIDIWSAVPVRDFSGREQSEKSLAQAAKVKATPTFVFFDLGGNEVVRHPGTVDTPEEFLLLGEFVASGAYKTRTFAQYKANRKGS